MSQSIGQTIRRLRKERNLTQEELAVQLNVTSQAVSKWENETGMPDISQIVPLASVFGVSTDVLFCHDETTSVDEEKEIVEAAESVKVYGKPETYLQAYRIISDGLKKYPNSLILLVNGMNLGLSLSLPENGWLYEPTRAAETAPETIRRAKLVIALSKNANDIMRAHQALVYLYCSLGDFDKATEEARGFPAFPCFTLYSNMATVNEYMGNHERTISYLSTELDYSLANFEDTAARLGKAYCKCGRYDDAATVYETFFAVMRAIYGNGFFPPYHDFDSGDCYMLLAEAYLSAGKREKAMDSLERAVMYYLDICKAYEGETVEWSALGTTPLTSNSMLKTRIDKSAVKAKLTAKLTCAGIAPLRNEDRYRALYEKVMSYPD